MLRRAGSNRKIIMQTLAQLKKDIVPGLKIECTGFTWFNQDGTVTDGVPPKMQGVRTVESKNTVGFILNGSHFDWPKASELNYDGTFIKVSPRDANGRVFQTREYTIIKH